MRIEYRVRSDYFEWMHDIVCGERFSKGFGYRKLLTFLHDTEFVYFVPYDENRAADGESLRYHYCLVNGCEALEWCLEGPCSVLEMMIALAIRCEEDIMVNPEMGNRTAQWFWNMISTMGLASCHDGNFDRVLVEDVVDRFLKREYEPNGRGGLFYVRDWDPDVCKKILWL